MRRNRVGGPLSPTKKRAMIAKIITQMQQAIRVRVVKFLQQTFNTSSTFGFQVAKTYSQSFQFEQLKKVYYSDLDIRAVSSLYHEMQRSKKTKTRTKSGLPPPISPNRRKITNTTNKMYRTQVSGKNQHKTSQNKRQQQPKPSPSRVDSLPSITAHKRDVGVPPKGSKKNSERNDVHGQIMGKKSKRETSKYSSRQVPENVWSAIMTYDIELKTKEDEAKREAKRKEMKAYRSMLKKQVEEQQQRKAERERERREFGVKINQDVVLYQEENRKHKEAKLARVRHANMMATKMEQKRQLKLDEQNRRREENQIAARQQAQKVALHERNMIKAREQKRMKQREQMRRSIDQQRKFKEEKMKAEHDEEVRLRRQRDNIQAEKARRRQEEVERREMDIKNRMSKMGSVFAAERQQQLDLDKKVSEEMARYNKMQDIELARRRKVQEMQLQNMMQSLEQMKKEKIDRKRQQEEENQKFAEEILRQDAEHARREKQKQDARAVQLKKNSMDIARQLKEKPLRDRNFEEPVEIVSMNTGLLNKIARESEAVDVSNIIGNLPSPPHRVLIKQRAAKKQVGGRGMTTQI